MIEEILDDEALAQIMARCKAARPAPWNAIIEGRDQTSGSSFIMVGEGNERDEDIYLIGEDKPVPNADFDFIANARQDIPKLLAEILRLRKELAK